MSDFFRLPIGEAAGSTQNPFEKFGLEGNPFPPSGVESGVLFQDHAIEQLKRMQRWIDDVATATTGDRDKPESVSPLAVFGSLGVGKTHMLSILEQGLGRNPSTPVLRKGLADEGMTRLVLADLFLRYLPFSNDSHEPGTGLLRKLVRAARASKSNRDRMLKSLRPGSPVQSPFFAVVDADDEESILWLSRWLRREYTTPTQRAKLGLSGVLQSEGEAISAIADLIRLANAAGLLHAWFVFIDQLEELWRPNVITPTRRARFLTDLRHLVDESLAGAPIALLLAWNTTVDADVLSGPAEVRSRLETDYRALLQRLGEPVDLPMLRPQDIWPFAKGYLGAVRVPDNRRQQFERFEEQLKQAAPALVAERRADRHAGLAPRKVLAAWRKKADELATAPQQPLDL